MEQVREPYTQRWDNYNHTHLELKKEKERKENYEDVVDEFSENKCIIVKQHTIIYWF